LKWSDSRLLGDSQWREASYQTRVANYTTIPTRRRARFALLPKLFFIFPNLFAICRDTFRYIQQMVCWEARAGRGVPCSTPGNNRVKTLCGCREKRVQTKEKYKLRLTTKAYKLSYNYINYTIKLVGRSFGKWRRRLLRSGGSRRIRRMSFGCAVRRVL
jgi:hypothetical protein